MALCPACCASSCSIAGTARAFAGGDGAVRCTTPPTGPAATSVEDVSPSGDPDCRPGRRIKAIAEASSLPRTQFGDRRSLLQDWSQFAAPAVFGVRHAPVRQTNLTEAGRAQPRRLQRAWSTGAVVLPGVGGQAMTRWGRSSRSALNITVMSLNGKLDVGLISCASGCGPVGHGLTTSRSE